VGTPKGVHKQGLECLDIFSPGGGFIFAAIHNIVAKIPLLNIIAVFDVVREFSGAPA